MSAISGFVYPGHGKNIFQEDFIGEQDAVSNEIIERWKKVFGTGVIWGGAVTISATALKVDVAEFFGFDEDGKNVYFPAQTGQVTLAEGTNTIVARHKFVETEYNQPFSDGQVSIHRTNSFEIIARTSGAIAGDIPLRTVTMASGARTLGSDLRTFASLQAKINRIDELGTTPAGTFADIRTRLDYCENLRTVGEIFWRKTYKAPSADFPALPLTWSDRTLSATNWPDLIDELRAEKWVYMPGEGAEKSAFDITHYARTSNVVTITLANTTAELAILAALAEDNLVHGSFSSWIAINLPVSLGSGDVPAGDYAISAINAGSRTISFAHTGSNVSITGVSRTMEIYPNRIPGSTTTARHYCINGRSLVSANDTDGEVIAGARRRDRFQDHAHETSAYKGDGGDFGNGSATSNAGNYSGSSAGFRTKTGPSISDGTNGNTRTGKTTDPRALGAVLYMWARTYVP